MRSQDGSWGAAPRLGDLSLLKRLMFEAATFVIAQLKQAVQSESTEGPRRLPAAEKLAREADQRRRLSGVNIKRDLVPSHSLAGLCNHMNDLNTITWIVPIVSELPASLRFSCPPKTSLRFSAARTRPSR